MKRALTVGLVFGAGALLLWWADSSSRARSVRAAKARPTVEVDPAPPPPAAQDDDPPARVVFRGATRLRVFPAGLGRQTRTHEVSGHFEPQDAQGRSYLVRDFETRVYGAQDERIETIEAERARFRLDVEPSDTNPFGRVEISEEGRVALEEVVITRHTGHPLAPLVFRAPALDVFLTTDRLVSIGDAQVVVEGRGLEAEGQGLLYEGATGLLALQRGGELRLERAADGPIRFRTPTGGPLEVARVGAPGQGRLELRARDGGELLARGDPVTQVEADTITLEGRARGDVVLVERGTATGSVVARRGPERYRGESARIELDGLGRVTEAVLDDQPEARTRIVDEDGVEQFVVARGKGPLTAWLDPNRARSFLLVGPGSAEIEGQDLEIEAEGRIEGSAAGDLSSATLLAREGVTVTHGPDRRLDTESLDALFLAGAEDAVDLTCVGPTRMTGRDETGAVVTVDVEHEAEIDVRGERWTVPRARGVVVHALGEEPFRANAGLVLDLDPITREMQLEEGVSWVGVFGEADASRAVVRGPSSATLYGLDEASPARFRVLPQRSEDPSSPETVELVSFAALTIDAEPDHVTARGSVHARLEESGRIWSLDAARTELTVGEPEEPGGPRTFSFSANDVSRAELVEGASTTVLSCNHLLAGGRLIEAPGEATLVEVTWAVATGGVTLDRAGVGELHARGARLTYQGGAARLTADPGEKVQAWGPTVGGVTAWRFAADALIYDGARVGADGVDARFEAPLLPAESGPDQVPATIEADHVWLEQDEAVFEGNVLAQGTDPRGIPLKLTAGRLRIVGAAGGEGGFSLDQVELLQAEGGFVAVYGGLALMRGESCELTRSRVLLLGGEGRDALLDAAGMALHSPRLDLDLERFLVTSARGRIEASAERGGWTLSYAELQPVDRDGETLMVLTAPRLQTPGDQLARADFAAFWLEADAWAARGREMLFGKPRELSEADRPPVQAAPLPPQAGLMSTMLYGARQGELGEYVKAVHVEGTIEVTEQGMTAARASEAFLDLRLNRGWLMEATLVARMDLSASGRSDRVRVRSHRVTTSEDGSLRAQNATMTTSKHEVPGYVIETGELVLAAREDGTWSFSARPNRIRFKAGFSLPLPPLGSIVLDDEGGFVGIEDSKGNVRTIENLKIGNTARMGTEVGTAVRYPIGDLGRKIGRFFGFDDYIVRGDWRTEGSYLSSRGILLGVGLELRERKSSKGRDEDFWFDLYARGLSDSGKDSGLVRVDRSDREHLRTWIHGRGRYPFSRTAWIDASLSIQSDPGVQAEFYQGEYELYEQRENDLHWRAAEGSTYVSARVMGRIDTHRTTVEELPSVGLYGGETPLAMLGNVPLLWRRSLDLAHLSRREGNLGFEDPFFDSLGDPDGLGNREVLRASTEHRLSAPVRTGLAGVTATPWLATQLTAWDEGVLAGDDPTRAALVAGVDLATVLHKRTENGFIHTLSPTFHLRSDLAVEEHGGLPVRFDELEDPVEGDEIGAGLRALWLNPTDPHSVDLSLRLYQRRDRGALPGKDRVELLNRVRTELFGKPVGLLTDMRIDPDTEGTVYGRNTAAIAPTEDWVLQVSHFRGRAIDGSALFESAAFSTRWTLDPKWEVELTQAINLLQSGTLNSELVLRRFGADFLFELQIQNRAGEGGTGVSINFAPMFTWKRDPFGILGI